MEELNRIISIDAIFFITLIQIIVHIILIKKRDYKSLRIYHFGGFLNFLLELLLIINHSRIIETNNFFLAFMVLLILSWFEMGFFALIGYINIRKIYGFNDLDKKTFIILNIIFFIGLIFASINWGIFQSFGFNPILTRRFVFEPLIQPIIQLIGLILFSGILIVLGYKKLTILSLIMGIIVGLGFQIRLYLSGIRQNSSLNPFIITIDTLTLASLSYMIGIFIMIIIGWIKFEKFGDEPPLPSYLMNLHITIAAIKSLYKQIGFLTLFPIIKDLISMQKNDEPWKGMPEPKGKKDIGSRALIGDAILIYRSLKKRMKQEEAERIIKKVIMESAIKQLYSLVPIIKKEEVKKMNINEAETMLTNIVEKFPNTNWELIESSMERFAYKITRCRLVELVKQVGHPELSDAFCPGDALYFKRYQKDIDFSRPKNIASGDECCDFIFSFKS